MIKTFFNRNNIWFGLGLGIIIPMIMYALLMLLIDILSNHFTFGIPLISVINRQLIAVFLNLFIFKSYLIKKEYEMTGRGVVIATFLYTLVHFYLRWGLMEN